MTKTILIIDGDVLAFRCAAANETRSIRVTNKLTGQVTGHAHRTAFKEHIKGTFELDEFDIEDVQTCEDISHAYHALKTCVDAWMKSCDADGYEVYLSGHDNFRDSLPLPSKYKGSRSGSIKPVQLAACREYLVSKYDAEIIHGMEVDDKLAYRCYEGLQQKVKTVAVTIDGDQNGVAGWMYNWTKQREPKLVNGFGYIELTKENKDFDGYGRKFYYAQWVLGDSVDCFKPCELAGKKFGVVAMYNLLKDCKTDKGCVEAVYGQYKKWYPTPVTYIAWDGTEHTKDAIALMDLYAACAHMKRFDGDVFDTKKLLMTLGVNYE